MTKPPWEVADIIRRAGNRFVERYRGSLTWAQLKVLRAIERCRTAALGGHRDQCVRCGHQAISYNSCRNRHCSKCQTNARERWLRAREQELLPVCYFNLVFSVPHTLVPLIWSRVFRGKFVAGLKQAFHRNQLAFYGGCQPQSNEKAFAAFLRTLFREEWVVYAKAPFGGPEHVLQYLARYTHRVAISNHRLLSVDDNHVTFRWKDYAHHSKCRAMTLTLEEFLRRFLQHVLPKGFPRIRYFGWLANRRRRELFPLCRTLLAAASPTALSSANSETAVWQCPVCCGAMRVVERLTAMQILREEQSRRVCILDSS